MIQVQCQLPLYVIDGIDMTGPIKDHEMIVTPYIGNRTDLVVLHIKGHTYAVKANDLMAAIENTQNVNR